MLETAAVPVADDPADVVDVLAAVLAVPDGVPVADPVADEVPVVELLVVAAVPVVVAPLVCVAVTVGKFTAP